MTYNIRVAKNQDHLTIEITANDVEAKSVITTKEAMLKDIQDTFDRIEAEKKAKSIPPASDRQLGYLQTLGYNGPFEGLTAEQASSLIDQYKANKKSKRG